MKTKESKTVASYTYNGCGFPVTIKDAPMKRWNDGWYLDIDPITIGEKVALVLAGQSRSLTGVQIKFLRTWLGMSMREFAKKFDVSHAAVIKWEKAKDRPTSMGLNTERVLRMTIMIKLGRPAEDTIRYVMAFTGEGGGSGKLAIQSADFKKAA